MRKTLNTRNLLAALAATFALTFAAPAQNATAQNTDDTEETEDIDNGGGRKKVVEKDGFTYYKERVNHKAQVLDHNERIIIPWQRGYTYVSFLGNHFQVMKSATVDGKPVAYRGLCKPDGTEVISPDEHFSSVVYSKKFNHITVKSGGYTALYDADGHVLIPASYHYTSITVKSEKYYIASDGQKCGVHELHTGKVIIPKQRGYTAIRYNPVRHYFIVTKGKTVGTCLDDGTEAVPPVWDSVVYNTTTKTWKVKRTKNSQWEDYDAPTPNL